MRSQNRRKTTSVNSCHPVWSHSERACAGFCVCNATIMQSSDSYLLISDIPSQEPRLTQKGNATCHCFLLAGSAEEGRRTRCVFIRKQWCIVCIYRWPLFIGQGWNISPISHRVIAQCYITSENRIIIVESNCCSGAVLCWRRSADGDLHRVVFPPHISSPWSQWSSGHTAALIESNLTPDWRNPAPSFSIQFAFRSITEIRQCFSAILFKNAHR